MKSTTTLKSTTALGGRIFYWLSAAIMALGLLLLPLTADLVLNTSTGSTTWAGNGPGGGGSDGSGSGSGGGNNGAGKGGSNGQGGGNSTNKGDLYGDMIYLLRDPDGVPILDEMDCLQPLDEDGFLLPLNWWDPETYEIPDVCINDEPLPDALLAAIEEEDEDEAEDCDVILICESSKVEVDLGRLSVLRSPARVLDRHRDEASRTIRKGEGIVELDHGGRLMTPTPVEDVWATFDSPLINLALMREFHHWGVLWDDANKDGDIDEGEIVFDPNQLFLPPEGSPFDTYSHVLAAAFGLGAGDDKEGAGIDMDVVVRVNQILGLPDMDIEMDVIYDEDLDMYFIDYSNFEYTRSETYPGCISYDTYVDGNWVTKYDSIMHAVFADVDQQEVNNIEGYALSANDARRVLLFVHDIGDDALRGRVDKVFENTGKYCNAPQQ